MGTAGLQAWPGLRFSGRLFLTSAWSVVRESIVPPSESQRPTHFCSMLAYLLRGVVRALLDRVDTQRGAQRDAHREAHREAREMKQLVWGCPEWSRKRLVQRAVTVAPRGPADLHASGHLTRLEHRDERTQLRV
eukprot:COSAG03_NODE_8298_length_815_cov_2692.902235_2_plen_134_part_00